MEFHTRKLASQLLLIRMSFDGKWPVTPQAWFLRENTNFHSFQNFPLFINI